jgi:putative transposase
MTSVKQLAADVGVAAACEALGVARSSFYQHQAKVTATTVGQIMPAVKRPTPARALSAGEQQKVLATLNSQRFADASPRQVYAELLDDGDYLCSQRTMYRLLAANDQLRERRDQLRHPAYSAPELLAERVNQVWSWDITKLKSMVPGTCYHLYVILDIFSRYVVGWMIADREDEHLAAELIEQSCHRQQILPQQLTLHADRGASMRSKTVALLLSDLDVHKSHSRPYCSNDNAYSESQFKTMKYRPEFPARFGSLEESRAFCQRFFTWYNTQHRHSGIAMLTPEMVHYHRADAVIAHRDLVLAQAFQQHPDRFVRKVPTAPRLPDAVWINKPVDQQLVDSESSVI